MSAQGVGRLFGSMLAFWVVALGLMVFAATGKAEQKLVTIDAPSNVIDLSTQNLAGPVSSTMGPHPGELKANVLLPDGYTKKKRYPLLLLLHVSGERFDSWADPLLGDISNTAKGLNAVIVMPEAAQGFYANWWNEGNKRKPEWETYIRDELLPLIENKFSIRTERRYHAVAGFSMGGYGTYLTGSLLPGYFGTVVPLSAFASIRNPLSQLAFQYASGGTDYQTVYGPANAYYAEGHDPLEWGPNLASTRMDVYTGNGLPDPAVRPENSPAHPGHLAEGDNTSLLLEGVLKTQNDEAVQAIRDAGNTTIDYKIHKGSHDWNFWKIDLKEAIGKGLFRPVSEKPSKWTYNTSSDTGQAWDTAFDFEGARTKMTTFTGAGGTLSASGDGTVNLSDGNGCEYTQTIPFTLKLRTSPCRRLKAKTKGRLKAGKKRTIRVTVTGEIMFDGIGPIDAARSSWAGRP
ncbi:MAG: hypothetical protein IPK93_12945 [Solirubrobacterales bacterium]|nr:hypothetical protein [Solirubrobacterales bacterium]